jgi:hypothetical protein
MLEDRPSLNEEKTALPWISLPKGNRGQFYSLSNIQTAPNKDTHKTPEREREREKKRWGPKGEKIQVGHGCRKTAAESRSQGVFMH